MNVSIGSEGAHIYRKNMIYRSLRKSSSQIMTNIKKKITDAEKTVRYRRALRPLNESRSPSPLPEIRIAASIVHHGKNVYATPNKGVLDGYTFDGNSNILLTPNHLTTPRTCPKKMGVMAHLRQMVSHRPLKRRPLLHDSPSETRLAKQLARARIREIQSPRKTLPNSTACESYGHDERQHQKRPKLPRANLSGRHSS